MVSFNWSFYLLSTFTCIGIVAVLLLLRFLKIKVHKIFNKKSRYWSEQLAIHKEIVADENDPNKKKLERKIKFYSSADRFMENYMEYQEYFEWPRLPYTIYISLRWLAVIIFSFMAAFILCTGPADYRYVKTYQKYTYPKYTNMENPTKKDCENAEAKNEKLNEIIFVKGVDTIPKIDTSLLWAKFVRTIDDKYEAAK
jgi:hypothetical protein